MRTIKGRVFDADANKAKDASKARRVLDASRTALKGVRRVFWGKKRMLALAATATMAIAVSVSHTDTHIYSAYGSQSIRGALTELRRADSYIGSRTGSGFAVEYFNLAVERTGQQPSKINAIASNGVLAYNDLFVNDKGKGCVYWTTNGNSVTSQPSYHISSVCKDEGLIHEIDREVFGSIPSLFYMDIYIRHTLDDYTPDKALATLGSYNPNGLLYSISGHIPIITIPALILFGLTLIRKRLPWLPSPSSSQGYERPPEIGP